MLELLALKWSKSVASAPAAPAIGVYLSNAIMEAGSTEGCLLVHRGLIERKGTDQLFGQKMHLKSSGTAGPVAAAGQCVLIK